MSKGSTILIKMESTAGTGFFYIRKKNPRTITDKMQMNKYDPRVRRHVTFKETKNEERKKNQLCIKQSQVEFNKNSLAFAII